MVICINNINPVKIATQGATINLKLKNNNKNRKLKPQLSYDNY